MSIRRAYAIAAGITWFGLGLGMVLTVFNVYPPVDVPPGALGVNPDGIAGLAGRVTDSLSYFTNLSNIIVAGNAVIVMPSSSRPIPAITLAECLATSDVPAGVVNILTGAPAEVMPWLAEHADVNALDLTGIVDEGVAADLERSAAGTVKRVRGAAPHADWQATPSLSRMRAFVEVKTVWHPMGV